MWNTIENKMEGLTLIVLQMHTESQMLYAMHLLTHIYLKSFYNAAEGF